MHLSKLNPNIKLAYKHCLNLAKNHYENFPVASFLLPKKLRYPIAAIYAFAREADDFSDEGNLTDKVRLEKLAICEQKLQQIQTNNFNDDTDLIYTALNHCIHQHQLPIELFFNLLAAFKQDVVKHNYENFSEVLAYCKNSANPVGRLLLHLTKNDCEENLELSDHICTALQLINFLQDLYDDAITRNRCYLPIDEMAQCRLSINTIKQKQEDLSIQACIKQQIQKAENILKSGKLLGSRLTGIFGLEIRLIINGGESVIQALYNRGSVYKRPSVKFINWIFILVKSLIKM